MILKMNQNTCLMYHNHKMNLKILLYFKTIKKRNKMRDKK